MELLRFLAVAVVGVVLDLAISYSLAKTLDLQLWVAAAVGFTVAAMVNYVAHELWTFRSDMRKPSVQRSIQYVGVAILTLLVRLVIVVWLGGLLDKDYLLVILACGVGVSFILNFTISKLIIFHCKPARENLTL